VNLNGQRSFIWLITNEMAEGETMDDPKHMVAANGLLFNRRGEVPLNDNPTRGWENPGSKV
jgi:hypothetical protein